MGHVDAVQQHRQLRGIQLRAKRVVMKRGQPEASLLEPLVRQHEAAAVPRQHLHFVAALRHEDEEVAGVEVFLPLVPDDGTQPVDGIAHVHRLGRQQDADRPREKQHRRLPERREELGQVAGVRAHHETHRHSAPRHGLQHSLPRLRRG